MHTTVCDQKLLQTFCFMMLFVSLFVDLLFYREVKHHMHTRFYSHPSVTCLRLAQEFLHTLLHLHLLKAYFPSHQRNWFCKSIPSWQLIAIIAIDYVIGTILCSVGVGFLEISAISLWDQVLKYFIVPLTPKRTHKHRDNLNTNLLHILFYFLIY